MGRFVKFEKERNQIPHLAAIVNATFHHATLSLPFLCVFGAPKPFSGTAKGLLLRQQTRPRMVGSTLDHLIMQSSVLSTHHYQSIISSFSFLNLFFFSFFCFLSIFTWSLSHKYEISPSLCFLFFVSALAMAAVLFELLDLVLCYFWPFCLSCGSVLFVFVHHCDIGCCFQSFDFDQIGGRLAIFLKKNRFLKRFLFAFKQ